MTRIVVPRDVGAEGVVAASVLVYSDAWASASPHLSTVDFTEREYWRVIEIAATLPAHCELPPMPIDDTSWLDEWWVAYSAREIAAVNAGVPRVAVIDELRRFHAATNLEPYVRRLQDATRRRDAMTRLADAYNLLGAGATLDEVRPIIDGIAA